MKKERQLLTMRATCLNSIELLRYLRNKKHKTGHKKDIVKPMNLSDAEITQKRKILHGDPEPIHGMAKVQGERNNATQGEDVQDKERSMKIERWEAEKEWIELQYPHGRWLAATFHRRFVELVTWLGDRPLGGIIHPAPAPWAVFKKPNPIVPEDVEMEEVEWFLHTL